jgi:predicted O-methyltransferase YrrM
MLILPRLVELYRAEGIEVCAGLPPNHFKDLPSAHFAWFVKDGRSLTNGLGIAPQEIYFLETLFASYRPLRVMVIGNSLGWSTLALALLLPEARILAIEAGFDLNSLMGLELTNRIAGAAGLQARAIKGVSPADVGRVIDGELGGGIDFGFIDGLHQNEQIVLDFEALRSKAAGDAIYLFHDVEEFDLSAGLAEIERLSGWTARRLRATPSGMALICNWALHPEVEAAATPFAPSPAALAVIEQFALDWHERRQISARWLNRLQRAARNVARHLWPVDLL